jgi:hypothetical protein
MRVTVGQGKNVDSSVLDPLLSVLVQVMLPAVASRALDMSFVFPSPCQ